MRFDAPLLLARLTHRPNRFVLHAEPVKPFDDEVPTPIPEEEVRAHLPNPGRLPEFLEPGTPWVLKHTPGPNRRTAWRAVMAWHRNRFVVLDTHLANPLVEEALLAGDVPAYRGWDVRREVKDGAHRFDFALTRDGETCLMEVKSVNLVPDRTARFPDSPTTRGTSHVRALAARARSGWRAAVLFIVARDDVDEVRANAATDPAFAEALADAEDAGVDVQAWTTRLDGREWRVGRRVPVRATR